MSLTIYYSDKIEELAEHLKEQLKLDLRNADPFVFSHVAVPNTNIAKWLQIRCFAKEEKLCAGIEFPFIEQELVRIMEDNLDDEEKDGFRFQTRQDCTNGILKILLEHPEEKEFAEFRRYIFGKRTAKGCQIEDAQQAQKAWQLADKLAGLMDQYETRRPEIVSNWLNGKSSAGKMPDRNSMDESEAALARALWGETGLFPPEGKKLSLRQLFEKVRMKQPKGEAETLYLFGFSTLTILHKDILGWLAKTHRVIFYHNNICLEYWGDIETDAERKRKYGAAFQEEDYRYDNPLLQNWGAAGRETIRMLVQLEERGDIEFTWECIADREPQEQRSVLQKIQDSIGNRTGYEEEKAEQDASLQIAGCPGIRREVEMVYNSILGSVWKPKNSGQRPWEECKFSDIAVLVPDMQKYRPMIEAVFDARDEVPYGLIDTQASEDSRYLAGFLALVDVARKGLTRETLFAVLDNPCVQEALGFDREQAANWRELTDEAGAYDGFEETPDQSKYNWAWALKRMRLAKIAEKMQADDKNDLTLSISRDTDDLQFSEIVELLYRRVSEVFGKPNGERKRCLCAPNQDFQEEEVSGTTWKQLFSGLMDDFLAVPQENSLESAVRSQILRTMSSLKDFGEPQDYEFAVAAIEQTAGGLACRKGGYLTHGVTIASLQPMRPVPFKQIYVLGLNAGGFPGKTGTSTLDIRGTGWHLGDISIPKINRYLFLETLSAARDRLVLSYQNKDIEKDAELFPSGLIQELEEFAGKSILKKEFQEFQYPLLERGEISTGQQTADPAGEIRWSHTDCFAGLLPTYSVTARKLAGYRRGQTERPARPVFEKTERSTEVIHFSAKELAEFIKEPIRGILKNRFGIGVEGYRDHELNPDSPLGIPDAADAMWPLQAAWIEGENQFEQVFREFQMTGRIPNQKIFGDFAKNKIHGIFESNQTAINGFKEGKNCGFKTYAVWTTEIHDIKVFLEADLANWYSSNAQGKTELSVLMTGSTGNTAPNLPPERVLEPLLDYLIYKASGGEAELFHAAVIDFSKCKYGEWKWKLSQKEAQAYLEGLVEIYLHGEEQFRVTATEHGKPMYANIRCRKLAEAIEKRLKDDPETYDWEAIAAEIGEDDYSFGKNGNQDFDNNLIVKQAIEHDLTCPEAQQMKMLYETIYQVPFSGEKVQKEAQS